MPNPEPALVQRQEVETQRPNHQLIAQQFSEISKLLDQGKSLTFNDTNKNYARELCEWIDSFIEFVGNKSRRMEVIEFFESFETTTSIERADIIQFIEMVTALENTDEEEHDLIESLEPKKWRKVEMLRAIFSAFGLLHTDIISGAKKPPTNPLVNLYHNHVESNGEYNGRLYPDNDALVYFTPDADTNGRLFTRLKEPINQEHIALTLVVNTVPQEVEAVLSGETGSGDEGGLELRETSAREGTPGSNAKKGRFGRRVRDRGIKTEMETRAVEKLDQDWYDREIERLSALSIFLHERFEELRNHLLENIPFVGEVIDYLDLINRLKEKGYKVDSLDVNELRRDFERLVTDYTRLISSKKAINIKLHQDIANLKDKLPTASDFEQKKLQRRVSKNQGRIESNNADIHAYEVEMASRKRESSEIFTQVTGYRLTTVPNREQFSLAFHHSLRAEELYSAPDFIPENPVTYEWIEANIIPLFVSILGTHLDEFHGVNIRDLYEFMRKIDELPEEYNDTVNLPDTENVSQRKASDFFAMLLPIIPKDYLSEIPNHGTIVTPEGIYVPKEISMKAPKIRKTQSERRAETSTRKAGVQKSRLTLIKEIQGKDEVLKEYEQYWREKLRLNIKARITYASDIEKIGNGIKRTRSHPTKSIEELEALKVSSRTEEQELRARIKGGNLKNDEATYKKLLDDRAQLSRKLGRLK